MTSILPSKSFIFYLYFHLQNFVFFIFSLTFSNLLLWSWYLTRELLTSFQNFWCIKLFLRRPLKKLKTSKIWYKNLHQPKILTKSLPFYLSIIKWGDSNHGWCCVKLRDDLMNYIDLNENLSMKYTCVSKIRHAHALAHARVARAHNMSQNQRYKDQLL